MKKFLFLLLFISNLLHSYPKVSELFILKSTKGSNVKIVAIYSAGPDGLTFSPLPDAPLIGSRELAIHTTPWENISMDSLKKYSELYQAYLKAQESVLTELNIGPHFFDLEDVKKPIRRLFPNTIIIDPQKETPMSVLLRRITDRDTFKNHSSNTKNPANHHRIIEMVNIWEDIHDDLEKISYRTDVLRFRGEIKSAVRAVEKIRRSSNVFNESAVRDINKIVNYSKNKL